MGLEEYYWVQFGPLNVRQVGCQRWKLRGKSGIGIRILESMEHSASQERRME